MKPKSDPAPTDSSVGAGFFMQKSGLASAQCFLRCIRRYTSQPGSVPKRSKPQ